MQYALIKNGIVENVIMADADFISTLGGYETTVEVSGLNVGRGYIYADGSFTPPEPEPVAKQTKFTKLEFQLRFTFDELVAIETAAETDAGVRVLQRQQQAAEFINILDPNTQLGILYLVSKGLLTDVRANEILK